MNNLGSFSYFCDQYQRFQELMGLRSTWQDIEKPLRAYRGLLYVGIHTTERSELVSRTLETASEELERRTLLAPLALSKQELESTDA